MIRCLASLASIAVLGACGGESTPSTPARPEPSSAAAPASPTPPPFDPAAASVAAAAAVPEGDSLAHLVDPGGHSTIVARETRGARTFVLTLRDEVGAGIDALPSGSEGDALTEAFEDEAVAGCPDVACMAQLAPSLGLLADAAAGRGASWHVAVLEGGRVIARRSLVALTVHDPSASGTMPPTMRVDDLDGDARLEVLVQVPVRPIRDDSMLTEHVDEHGRVAFVLDEAALAVQARWTSEHSMLGGGEWEGDDEAATWTEGCSRDLDEIGPGGLVLAEACEPRFDAHEVRCPYEASRDRYACPARFAQELFRPLAPEHVRHYVGEDEPGLARALGGLGTRVEQVRARARA
ncbi:MAG: hypothetical protein M3Y87_33345, partial [Myxococcota bacterium]|nr:hypothetical protein [Myxococcota bacterium]